MFESLDCVDCVAEKKAGRAMGACYACGGEGVDSVMAEG
jgi:hypothetical protein